MQRPRAGNVPGAKKAAGGNGRRSHRAGAGRGGESNAALPGAAPGRQLRCALVFFLVCYTVTAPFVLHAHLERYGGPDSRSPDWMRRHNMGIGSSGGNATRKPPRGRGMPAAAANVTQTLEFRQKSNIEDEFTTNFTFPSPRERLEYYMGDWFNRTLRPGEIACGEIRARGKIVSDTPVLWTTTTLRRETQKGKRGWLTLAYLVDALAAIRNSSRDGRDARLVLNIGDSHVRSAKLPVVSKTRFSRFARERGKGDTQFFRSIVFPLSMHRHYSNVDEYVKLTREGGLPKWEDKKETLIWRGALTGVLGKGTSDKARLTTHSDGGPRVRVVKRYFGANTSDVDVAFQRGNDSVHKWPPPRFKDMKRYTRDGLSVREQLGHKYLLSLEGNDVATGLKWQLASDGVVFMSRPTVVSYLMEDVLVPFVHYVPLKDDHSDLIEMVRWARANDRRCRWISRRATEYMERMWTGPGARGENEAIRRGLGEAYARQFGEAVASCGG